MAKRFCRQCQAELSNRSKRELCKACLSVCHCGSPKDFRADECISCGRSRKAKLQWQQQRELMLAGIREAQAERRTRFEDLGWETNWQSRTDGRRYTWIWVNGRKATIYRYQWVWRMAHGSIPHGYCIHHRNGDPTDDRLENLEMLSIRQHTQLHGQGYSTQARATWETQVCQQCGQAYQRKGRKDRDGRFCSPECYHLAQQETAAVDALTGVCQQCGVTFQRQRWEKSLLKYCSRACFQKARRSTI